MPFAMDVGVVRALDGGVLYQDVNGRVLFVDRVLDVVPGIAT